MERNTLFQVCPLQQDNIFMLHLTLQFTIGLVFYPIDKASASNINGDDAIEEALPPEQCN